MTHLALFGWTDSAVVLEWLRQHPSKWNVFVANRVAEIQTVVPRVRWTHVPTRENPADCASRGLTATELASHPLCWTGPTWLRAHSTSWPCHKKTESATKAECEAIMARLQRSLSLRRPKNGTYHKKFRRGRVSFGSRHTYCVSFIILALDEKIFLDMSYHSPREKSIKPAPFGYWRHKPMLFIVKNALYSQELTLKNLVPCINIILVSGIHY